MSDSEHDVHADAVEKRLPEASVAWWRRALAAVEGPALDERVFASAWAGAGRRCGDVERDARTTLLVRAVPLVAPAERAAFVRHLFDTGDNLERATLLAALERLPDPESHLDTAVEACRTNVVPVFEAIACDNDFPARRFPDAAFDQMVLKAVFLEVPVARIRGLAARATTETARMASDYADERRAAGRAVPADVALIQQAAGANP